MDRDWIVYTTEDGEPWGFFHEGHSPLRRIPTAEARRIVETVIDWTESGWEREWAEDSCIEPVWITDLGGEFGTQLCMPGDKGARPVTGWFSAAARAAFRRRQEQA